MQRKQPNIFFFIAIFAAILLFMSVMNPSGRDPDALGKSGDTDTYTYTEIVGLFQKGQVQEYTLDLNTMELQITKLKGEKTSIVYKVPDINLFVRDTENYIIKYNENHPKQPIKGNVLPAKPMPVWLSMLPMIILTVVLLGLWIYIIRKTQGGGGGGVSGFGKSHVQNEQGRSKVRFKDVAGADEEKQELTEVVDFLKNPKKFNMLGARIPKGVMLIGPPGTGKTLLAKAVAGEAGVSFFAMSGSDFVEMYVGVGASRVRDLFEKAKKAAPSVIFIDEIDAVGRQRGAGLGGGHDEREQTLNQLLVEMDGFEENIGVIVIAATNRADVLDSALLRPGRFDRQIMVGYPDSKGREAILRVHSANKPLAPDVDLEVIAKTTAGFTGADLENILNEAALLAARYNRKAITMEDVGEATIKVVAGPEKKSRVIIEHERKITAYHEAGHAIASYHCPTQDAVHQISIIPRGSAGGYTLNLPEADRSYKTKNQMYEDLVVLMGGRVAEKIVLRDVSTGASNDLERATKVARDMITRYGFSDKIGPVVYGEDQSQVFLGRDYGSQHQISNQVASEIDAEVHDLLTKAFAQTEDILTEHIDKLHLVAQYLLTREKVEKDEFRQLMEQGYLDEEVKAPSETTEESPGVSLEKFVDDVEQAEKMLEKEIQSNEEAAKDDETNNSTEETGVSIDKEE